jgi:UDP-4-amino-4,6-dideoxy-N-acetyl-beta-L-altrosamine transaminase
MEFIPYSRQNIDKDDVDAVCRILSSDFLTQGPVVPEFEAAFASRHQALHAVAVSNATAGLHICMLAFGVGPGSKVWTTPNSFVASANCARYCGADVDFVDIDPISRNMSVEKLRLKLEGVSNESELPKVVVPVDFSGLAADLKEMRALADRFGFKILEDASHATGASYLGHPVGSRFVDAAVFSFHAVKIVTTGEGGMIVTNDSALRDRLRQLRTHGITRDETLWEAQSPGPWYYEQTMLGYNYRMTEMQAALGLSQLARLNPLNEQRRMLAIQYDQLLSSLPLKLPLTLSDRDSARHLYVVEVDDQQTNVTRREVFDHLRRENIGVNVHYIPIHTQPYFRALGFRAGEYPMSERYYDRAISIPLYPALTEQQLLRVVTALRSALRC